MMKGSFYLGEMWINIMISSLEFDFPVDVASHDPVVHVVTVSVVTLVKYHQRHLVQPLHFPFNQSVLEDSWSHQGYLNMK